MTSENLPECLHNKDKIFPKSKELFHKSTVIFKPCINKTSMHSEAVIFFKKSLLRGAAAEDRNKLEMQSFARVGVEEVGWEKAWRNARCGDAVGRSSYIELRQVGQ